MIDSKLFHEKLGFFFENAPFSRLLGLQVKAMDEGFARLEVPFKPELIGNHERNILHGGVLLAAADTAGGLAVWTKAGPEARIFTIDLRLDFLHAAPPERLIVEARVIRAGSKVGVAEIKSFSEGKPEQLVSFGVGAYNIARAQ